jgi:hypothetical protein
MRVTLHYHEPGKRPGTTRKARRKVASVREGWEWMKANTDKAFFPAEVRKGWGNELLAAFV